MCVCVCVKQACVPEKGPLFLHLSGHKLSNPRQRVRTELVPRVRVELGQRVHEPVHTLLLEVVKRHGAARVLDVRAVHPNGHTRHHTHVAGDEPFLSGCAEHHAGVDIPAQQTSTRQPTQKVVPCISRAYICLLAHVCLLGGVCVCVYLIVCL